MPAVTVTEIFIFHAMYATQCMITYVVFHSAAHWIFTWIVDISSRLAYTSRWHLRPHHEICVLSTSNPQDRLHNYCSCTMEPWSHLLFIAQHNVVLREEKNTCCFHSSMLLHTQSLICLLCITLYGLQTIVYSTLLLMRVASFRVLFFHTTWWHSDVWQLALLLMLRLFCFNCALARQQRSSLISGHGTRLASAVGRCNLTMLSTRGANFGTRTVSPPPQWNICQRDTL